MAEGFMHRTLNPAIRVRVPMEAQFISRKQCVGRIQGS